MRDYTFCTETIDGGLFLTTQNFIEQPIAYVNFAHATLNSPYKEELLACTYSLISKSVSKYISSNYELILIRSDKEKYYKHREHIFGVQQTHTNIGKQLKVISSHDIISTEEAITQSVRKNLIDYLKRCPYDYKDIFTLLGHNFSEKKGIRPEIKDVLDHVYHYTNEELLDNIDFWK